MLVGIAALVAIAIFFLKGIRANLIVDAEDTSTALDEQHPGTAKGALDKAHELEEHSDFRGAIRALYLAALLYLHEHGLLTYDKSLTNREYLRALKEQPMMHEAFQPVVHIFDDVWYGYKPCTAETLSEYRGMVQKLREGQEG